jgi:hypothetical protein
MLWFNRDKGYGFIRTDAGDRRGPGCAIPGAEPRFDR